MPESDRKKITLTDADRKEIALAEYKEVADQFRKLTDIRFLLLTYLPLGTAAAAFFVAKDNELAKHPEISAFAFVVTLCIATYNKRNDQFYDELVSRAAELERELQIEHGSFSDRPKPWLKFGVVPIEHRWPIGLIYAAAASLWAYLFADALDKDKCWLEYLEFRLTRVQPWLTWLQFNLIWLKVVAPGIVIAFWRGLRRLEKAHQKKQREAVTSLMGQLMQMNVGDSPEQLVQTIAAKSIFGIDKGKAQRRVKWYWNGYEQKRDSHTASALLAAVLDVPARWTEDVWSGRR